MGQNVERLGRLRSNRMSIVGVAVRTTQALQRTVATTAVETVATGVQKAARTEGFEGDFGVTVAESLTKIRKDLDRFADYQVKLNKAIELANEAMQNTSNGADGLPDSGLTSDQQATINIATATGSPVTVQPGVTMAPADAQQYYLDQAAVAQEEQAAKLTAALDTRLQEIIEGLPESKYDPPKPPEDPTNGDDPSGHTQVPGSGVTSTGLGPRTGTGIEYAGIVPVRPPTHGVTPVEPVHPPIKHPIVGPPPTVHPPINPPVVPPVNPPGITTPNIDGNTVGTIPGGGAGGPGSVGGGLSGTVGGGGGGVAGVVGGAGLAARLGGDGRLTGGTGGASMAPGAGATGVVAQGGAAGGGRGGAMVGGAAGGGGAGGGGKRSRRRGQDLMAFQVEPDDEQAAPDLGAAGAAGRSSSDGREELGW